MLQWCQMAQQVEMPGPEEAVVATIDETRKVIVISNYLIGIRGK
jgi:hypothetical protein